MNGKIFNSMIGKILTTVMAVTMFAPLSTLQSAKGLAQEDTSRFTHIFRHTEKYRQNASGDTINETVFTANDETTYPFLYQSYTSAGSEWDKPGSQKNQILPMSLIRTDDWATGYIYAEGSWTGFSAMGGIASIDTHENETGIVLTFVSPYSGEVMLSDLQLDYSAWGYPNKSNGYFVNGGNYDETYDGMKFKITVNGEQVYPKDKEWNDTAFTNKYASDTTDTDVYGQTYEFASGDLKMHQEAEEIKGIYVQRYDKVNLIFTHNADYNESVNMDTGFDVVFSVDSTAELKDYKYVYSTLNEFDSNRTNSANNTLSYWYYDVTNGLYGAQAVKKLMGATDYANGAYTTALFGTAASANYNSLNVASGLDAAMVYRVAKTGDLLIKSENLYRGSDMALWEYFDNYESETMQTMAQADGVRLRIEINGERVWPTDKSWQEYTPTVENEGLFDWEDLTFGVKEGDSVAIRVNCGAEGKDVFDKLNFSPVFVLTPTDTPVTNVKITVKDGEDENKDNAPLGLIIGLSVGGVVIAAGAVGTILFIKKKKEKEKNEQI